MYDWPAESNCESENVIYRLFRYFLEWKSKPEAFKALQDDKPTSEDLPQNNSDNE